MSLLGKDDYHIGYVNDILEKRRNVPKVYENHKYEFYEAYGEVEIMAKSQILVTNLKNKRRKTNTEKAAILVIDQLMDFIDREMKGEM